MFTHILVPVDGSPTSGRAAQAAADLAREISAKVTVIHIVHMYPYAGFGSGFAEGQSMYLSAANAAATESIAAIRESFERAGVAVESRVVEANVIWRGIIDTAELIGADLIVMGTHGRSKIDRLLLGSVTHRVLSHAATPVMVVHSDD
jgi:nucleotide-binding universal stress UspA family protein